MEHIKLIESDEDVTEKRQDLRKPTSAKKSVSFVDTAKWTDTKNLFEQINELFDSGRQPTPTMVENYL
jgi:nitrate reductase assembly molybdenum cofactor insertion protein NarJ